MNKVIRFRPPCPPWSENKTLHWAQRSRMKRMWRETARDYGALARGRVYRAPEFGVNVQVTIPFTRGGRRDPHNYTGTVVKSIIDGLTDAGYWPDDGATWVTVLDPILVVGDEVIVTLTSRTTKVS